MRILVTGAGRSGSNLVAAIVRCFPEVTFDRKTEDRNFFKYGTLPENYGTKLCFENNGYTIEALDRMMREYPDLKVILSVRHPVDNCLCKVVRGQPKGSLNTDSGVDYISPDATPEGAIKFVKMANDVWEMLNKNHPNRFAVVGMEDIIKDVVDVADDLQFFLGLDKEADLSKFYSNKINVHQAKRYGTELRENQIDLYKKWDTIYGGYFKNRKEYVDRVKKELLETVDQFGYKIEEDGDDS